MTRGLVLLDSSEVGESTLRSIIHSAIFFGDSVAIRATFATPVRSSHNMASAIDIKVSELQEAGVVKLWAHEYELEGGGYAGDPSKISGTRRKPDLVVERDSFSERIASLDSQLREDRELAYKEGDVRGRPRQGNAEMVRARYLLSSMLLASELNQDGVVANPGVRHELSAAFERPPNFERAVLANVDRLLKLPPPWSLSVEDILICRQLTAGFRELLDDSLRSAAAGGLYSTLTASDVAREVVARYERVLRKSGRESLIALLAEEGLWDAVGTAMPPSLVLKYGLKALKWRREAREARPFLLLMYLQRAAQGETGSS